MATSSTGNVINAGNFSGLYGNPTGVTQSGSNYSNANVINFLPIYSGNLGAVNSITASGNIVGQSVVANVFMWANGTPLVQPQAYGNSNVAAWLPTNTNANILAPNLSVTGTANIATVRTNNYQFANGTPISFAGNYSNANVTAYLPTNTANVQAGNLFVIGRANVGNVSSTGTITAPNITAGNAVNTDDLFVLGNSNASVLRSYDSFTGIDVIPGNGIVNIQANVKTGNVFSNGYFFANGAPFTQYSNANVAAYLPTYSGNIGAGNVNVTSNVTAYVVQTTGVGGDITGANNITANAFYTPGNASVGAIKTDTYLYANGTPVSFSGGGYGNTQVAAFLPTYTGNLSPGNIMTNNYLYANGQPFTPGTNYSNANVAAYIPTDPTIITIQGNVANTNSNVANLATSLTGTNSNVANTNSNVAALTTRVTSLSGNVYNNANVAAYLSTATGNIATGNLATTANTIAIGNFAQGFGPAAAANAVAVGPFAGYTGQSEGGIALGSHAGLIDQLANAIAIGVYAGRSNQGSNAIAIGLYAGESSQANNSIIINASGNTLNGANAGLYINPVRSDATPGNIAFYNTVTKEVTYGPVPATYGNANVAAYLGNAATTGNIYATNMFAANTVTATTFVGNFQGNVTGNIVVPGSNGWGLYNNNGNAGADVGFQYTVASKQLSITGNIVSNAYVFGNAAFMTGIPTAYGNANVEAYLPTSNVIIGINSNVSNTNSNVTILTTNTQFEIGNTNANVANLATSLTGTNSNVANLATSLTGTNSNVANTNSNVANNTTAISSLTGLVYTNANVAAYLPTYTGLLAGGNLSVTGQVNSATISTTGTQGNISGADYVIANYFVGNGSLLTNINAGNIVGSYSNANVAAYLPTDPTIISIQGNAANTNSNVANLANVVGTISTEVVSLTGAVSNTNANVSSTNSNVANLTQSTIDGFVSVNSNVANTNSNVANLTTSVTGVVSALANTNNDLANTNSNLANLTTSVTGITSNVANLQVAVTSLTGNVYGNANVAAYLPTYTGNLSGNDFSITGNLTAADADNVSIVAQNQIALESLNFVDINSANLLNLYSANKIALQGAANGVVVTGNLSTIGNVTATANIQGSYILGNGAFLTGLPAQYSNANVAAYLPTYTGNLAGGNLSVSSIITGANISVTGNIFTSGKISTTGNVYGATLYGTTVSVSGRAQSANVYTTDISAIGLVTATGNITGGNIRTAGSITATGNIQGNVFIGNGAVLTNISPNNIVGTFGNISAGNISLSGNIKVDTANATDMFVSNTITATTFIGNIQGNIIGNLVVPGSTGWILYNNAGNAAADNGLQYTAGDQSLSVIGNIVTSGNFVGNGAALTGMYGNANVAAYLPTYTGLLAGGNLSVSGSVIGATVSASGSIQGGNLRTAGLISATGAVYGASFLGAAVSVSGRVQSQSIYTTDISAVGLITATGNVSAGNLRSLGNVTATGNIQGSYILGNGAFLTGLPAQYSNANVAAYIPTDPYIISLTGNVTTLQGNVVSLTAAVTSLTGNVYNDANVAAYLPTYTGNISGGNLSVTGIVSSALLISAGNLTLDPNGTGSTDGNVIVAGNLIVQGTTTTINSNTITTNDLTINVANNASSNTAANGGGLGVGPQGAEYASWTYNSVYNHWSSNLGISAAGNIVAPYFEGNGSLLTNINAGNIVGSYGNANVEVYLPTSPYIANITGNVSNATSNITILQGNVVSLTGALANTNSNVSNVANSVASLTGNVYGNANVAAYLPTYTGNLSPGNITTSNILGDAVNALTLTANNTSVGDIHLNAGNVRFGKNNQTANISTRGTGNMIISTNEGGATEGNITLVNGVNGNINITPNGTGVVNIGTTLSVVGSITSPTVANITGNVTTLQGNVVSLTGGLANTNSNVANTNSNVANVSSSVANITGGSANVTVVSANTATTIDTLDGTLYRSGKYVIQVTSGASYQTQESLVVTDGTTAQIGTYSIVQTGSNLGAVSATQSGSNVLLQFTAVNAGSVVRLVRQYVAV